MAEFYLDRSARTAGEYEAWTTAVPTTWGPNATDKPRPMEGNGKHKDASTAQVAIAEIQITALPADGKTLTIAGATLTAKTTVAAKNQWAIGASITACVSNLVTVLNTFGTGNNQCDAAVSTGASRAALALPYFLAARVKPGTTDTIQLATRCAGADLNYIAGTQTATQITHAANWNGTDATGDPVITQFAGGVDGPFGWAYNTSDTPFGRTSHGGHGLFFAATVAGATAVSTSDLINVRSGRGGAAILSGTLNPAAGFHSWNGFKYLIDDGTVWNDGQSNGTHFFDINFTGSSASWYGAITNGSTLTFEARKREGAIFRIGATSASGNMVLWAFNDGLTSGSFNLLNCGTNDLSATGSINLIGARLGALGFSVNISDSVFRGTNTLKARIAFSATGLTHMRLLGRNVKVEVASETSNITALVSINPATFTTANASVFEFYGGEVSGTLGSYTNHQIISGYSTLPRGKVVVDGVKGIQDMTSGFTRSAWSDLVFIWTHIDGKAFRYETPQFTVDWKNNGSFPYLNSPNWNSGFWSKRVTWVNVGNLTPIRGSHFVRTGGGIKRITLELLVPAGLTIYKDDVELRVRYSAASEGNPPRYESSHALLHSDLLAGGAAELDSSSAVWNYGDGTVITEGTSTRRKITFVTSEAVADEKELVWWLVLVSPKSPEQVFYVNPEIVVEDV